MMKIGGFNKINIDGAKQKNMQLELKKQKKLFIYRFEKLISQNQMWDGVNKLVSHDFL